MKKKQTSKQVSRCMNHKRPGGPCRNTAYVRGVCQYCRRGFSELIRTGQITEKQLIDLKLMLPNGSGGTAAPVLPPELLAAARSAPVGS